MNAAKAELVERMIEMMSRSSFQLRREEPFDWPNVELTMPQLRTLVFLQRAPRRMSDIAAFLNIGLSSATSMIERLESKALVLRIHDPNDRRVVHCSLTEEGNDALERFWQVQTSKIKAVADILSHEELTKVVESMEILVTALERYDHETESRESLSAEFTQGADRS